MRYDPTALPFWEVERGGGYWTNLSLLRNKIRAQFRLEALRSKIRALKLSASPSATGINTQIAALEREKRQLFEVIG